MSPLSTTSTGPGRHFFGRLRQWLAALLLLLAAPLVRAQAPAWQEALAPGGSGYSQVFATAADAAGNTYIAGGFRGTIIFGTTTLTSSSNDLRDVFVAKRSAATGNFVWAQRAGAPGDDYVKALTVSGNNVYLTGTFSSGQITFGATTLTNPDYVYTNTGYDGFVVKLVDAGSTSAFAWAQSFGGNGNEVGAGIAVNGSSVYIDGIFGNSTGIFGAITLQNAALVGSNDIFLAKLTDAGSTGHFVWAERMGGVGFDFCTSLANDGAALYLAGSFRGQTATFGTTTLNLTGFGSTSSEDAVVVRFTDLGPAPRFDWVLQSTGSGTEEALDIATGPGGLYVVGRFAGRPSATFGSAVVPNSGELDGYVAKIIDTGATGTFAWAQGIGGPLSDGAFGLAVRGSNLYVGGTFQGTVSFGTSATATSQGRSDVFVTRLVDTGPAAQLVWTQTAGGSGTDNLSAVQLVGTRVYAAGDVIPSASFGSRSITGPTGGGTVGFLASLTDAVGLATTSAGPLAGSSLWPNPAHAAATVQLPPVPGATSAILSITDALGRVVRTATVALPAAGLRHPLDLAGLPAGLYAVRVAIGDRAATHRLVVQ